MSTSERGRGRRAATAVVVVLCLGVLGTLAVLLVAGGGGGGCRAEGYPDTPDCVAREYAGRSDPSKCDLLAPALLEQLTGLRGEGARRRCARSVRASSPPRRIEVIERETVGDTVVVELVTDGREGKITMARSGGRWQITSFAE